MFDICEMFMFSSKSEQPAKPEMSNSSYSFCFFLTDFKMWLYLVKRRRHFPHSIITHMTEQRHLFWWALIFAKRKIIFRSVWSSSLYQGESKFQIYRHLSYLFLERETERISENVYNIDLKLKSRSFLFL